MFVVWVCSGSWDWGAQARGDWIRLRTPPSMHALLFVHITVILLVNDWHFNPVVCWSGGAGERREVARQLVDQESGHVSDTVDTPGSHTVATCSFLLSLYPVRN